MAKNDDRKRKVQAGGKGLSVVLQPEAQEALEVLRTCLSRQGRPHSKEAAVNRALTWAAEKVRRGQESPATPQGSDTGQAHEPAHEVTREEVASPAGQAQTPARESAHEETHEERISALEERIMALEQALLHGVQPGQWGGF